MKKTNISAKFGVCELLIGGCAILIGCLSIFMMFIHPLFGKKTLPDYLFLTIILLIMVFPVGFAAYFWFRLIKKKTKRNIKVSVGLITIFAVSILNGVVETLGLSNHIGLWSRYLLMTITVLLIYIPVSKFLMLREGLIPKPKGEFVGKGIITILAWQIWLVGSEIAEAYLPKNLTAKPWNISDISGLIAPIIIACVFYKVAVKFIQKDKTEQVAKDKINEPGQI